MPGHQKDILGTLGQTRIMPKFSEKRLSCFSESLLLMTQWLQFVTVAWIFPSGGAEMQNSDCLFFFAQWTPTSSGWSDSQGMRARIKINPKVYPHKALQQNILKKSLDHSLLIISSSFFLCIRKAHCFFEFGTAKKAKKMAKELPFRIWSFFWRVVLVTKPGGSTSNDKVSSLQVHPKS